MTDLGNEIRAEVARILKRFGENDIAAVKVSTLRKLDAYLNPEPDGFEIDTRRERPWTYALNLRNQKRLAADNWQELVDEVLFDGAAS